VMSLLCVWSATLVRAVCCVVELTEGMVLTKVFVFVERNQNPRRVELTTEDVGKSI
jgi:hypothetical protein